MFARYSFLRLDVYREGVFVVRKHSMPFIRSSKPNKKPARTSYTNEIKMSVVGSAAHLLSQYPSLLGSTRTSSRTLVVGKVISCSHEGNGHGSAAAIPRRSACWQPTLWSCDFLGSLASPDFSVEGYGKEREKMIAEVKDMINNFGMDHLSLLEFIDAIERLGLSRHFREDIKRSIENVYKETPNFSFNSLYSTSLRFRMLRQHGYHIPEDVFNQFKDPSGSLCDVLSDDVKGYLCLFEASFLDWEGDKRLVEYRAFAEQYLREQLHKLPSSKVGEVRQALELPLHRRFPRLRSRWSIETYEKCQSHSNLPYALLRLAKLDYNLVQSGYKEEVKRLARWWAELDLPRKMPYSRDRLMEHYLWTVGSVEEPEYNQFRVLLTKVNCIVTAVDDSYDVYGTVEELEILTNLINRWDTSGIDQLPEPMRHCLLAVYNTSNDIADWVLKEKGFCIIPYLSKAWARLSNKYLQEAKWHSQGYKPCLKEYLDHASISISAHLVLLVTYFLTTSSISKEAIDYIENIPSLLLCGGTIIRLSNDLATSTDELARGDNIKALECYMSESGASEEAAREHINDLINQSWKKINKDYYLFPPQYPATISEPFIGANLNLARASQFFYNFKKDWHGKPDKQFLDHIKFMLIVPVPMII